MSLTDVASCSAARDRRDRPEEDEMFDVYCTTCQRRSVVPAGSVAGIVNDERGIHVVFRCSCGEPGVWTTGRRTAAAAA